MTPKKFLNEVSPDELKNIDVISAMSDNQKEYIENYGSVTHKQNFKEGQELKEKMDLLNELPGTGDEARTKPNVPRGQGGMGVKTRRKKTADEYREKISDNKTPRGRKGIGTKKSPPRGKK